MGAGIENRSSLDPKSYQEARKRKRIDLYLALCSISHN